MGENFVCSKQLLGNRCCSLTLLSISILNVVFSMQQPTDLIVKLLLFFFVFFHLKLSCLEMNVVQMNAAVAYESLLW